MRIYKDKPMPDVHQQARIQERPKQDSRRSAVAGSLSLLRRRPAVSYLLQPPFATEEPPVRTRFSRSPLQTTYQADF